MLSVFTQPKTHWQTHIMINPLKRPFTGDVCPEKYLLCLLENSFHTHGANKSPTFRWPKQELIYVLNKVYTRTMSPVEFNFFLTTD